MSDLVAAWRANLPDELSDGVDDDLAAPLAAAVACGVAAVPGAVIDAARFVAYLAARVERESWREWLADAAIGDLGLAFACVHGDPAAIAQLERNELAGARGAIGRIAIAPSDADDVMASVRAHLLTGMAGGPPRLGDYSGRGPLAIWIRVVAIRAAISAMRRARPASDDGLVELVAPSDDPEITVMLAQCRAELKVAFTAATATLTARERNLLRQHLLDGMTIDEIAPLYRVHRVTAARWLSAAREKVWAATLRDLRRRLALGPTEIDSLLGHVRSQLDLSLERILA